MKEVLKYINFFKKLFIIIQCIVSIGTDTFCSGSNDRQLYIWKKNGEFINSIERQEEESKIFGFFLFIY